MVVRRRTLGPLLILPILVVGLAVLAWRAAPPSTAQWQDPDLAIHLYRAPDDTDPFAPGNEITYQIYVVNWSMTIANDVLVTITLPEHSTYVSSSGPGFGLVQAGPTQVIWHKDRLSDFERAWLSVTVRVNADAPLGAEAETQAEIYCIDGESNYDNNVSTVKEYVLPAEPDLQVTVHLWPNSNPIAADNEIVYEIAVQNLGGAVANGVRLTDTLPADCTYVSDNPAGSGFAPAQTGQTVVWTQASLAPAKDSADSELLYVHCQIANTWTPDQWLENVVEVSTTDAECGYDNNLSRWTYKPEADRRYGASITSLDHKSFRQISDANFDYVLYYLDWSAAEPVDGKHNWADLDAAVWQAWRYNLRLVVRVDRAPTWARGPGTDTAPPGDPDKLSEFLQTVAARWPRQPSNGDEPQIHGYVVWNEPNLAAEWGGNAPNAAAYTSLLQAAHTGVQAASPDAWVISAGLATTGDDPPSAVDDRTYLQAMYTAGAGSYFDYLGVNPLGFASAPDDVSDPGGYYYARALDWRQIMVDHGDGDKDMFATELGWLRETADDLGDDYNWMKVSAVDQAHYLARAYHKARCDWQRLDGTSWMGPMITWNLGFAGDGYATGDHPYWFSVTDENRDPLRAYLTLQNAARLGPADLWVEKELIDPVRSGQDYRYVLRYTNIGGQMAPGVVLSDTLPADTEYVADTGGGVLQPGGGQVVWSLGDVDTCAYETITLTLHMPGTSPPSGELTNVVTASTSLDEPYTDDNVAEVTTTYPNAVTLASFMAEAQGRLVLLIWETASELDLLGFNVYRSDASGGEPIQVNEALIPGQAPGSPTGARYDLVDGAIVPGATYSYWLEDVDVYGGAVQHGPVIVAVPTLLPIYLPVVSK